MGGGGFSDEPENLALDRYFLSLSEKPKPKICFIGTASGDADKYLEKFYQSMGELECEPSHLSLYRPPEGDLREFVLDKDTFYVGGGSTRNLLALWYEWNLDQYLKEAYEKGAILGGIRAGAICWFDQGLTDSVSGKLLPIDALGFLLGSYCPHYDGEKKRRLAYEETISNKTMLPGLACDDGVAAHYINGKLHRIISSRPGTFAYRVDFQNDQAIETKLTPDYL